MNRELPSDLRARILAQTRSEPSPTVKARRRRVAVVSAIGIATSLVISIALGVPRSRPALPLAVLCVGGGLWAVAATLIAARRGRSMLGRPRSVLAVVAIAAPLGVFLCAVTAQSLGGVVPAVGGTALQHGVCFVVTLLFALGPFAAIAYARRGTDPVHPRALGAAIGGAAGAWGGALIDVHCTLVTMEHLALGHVAPIALLAAAGALVGARVFGIRQR